MKVIQTWGEYDNTAPLNGILNDVLTFGATASQDGTIASCRTDKDGAIFVSLGNGEKIYCEGKVDGLRVQWKISLYQGKQQVFQTLDEAIQRAKYLQEIGGGINVPIQRVFTI